MQRDPAAAELWEAIYPSLSAERTGLIGPLTARNEAHVLRLSMQYALLDSGDAIRSEHIAAAAELWGYCERSVEYIFGDSTGNPIADYIRATLAMQGELDRAAINKLFGGHVGTQETDHALALLAERGLSHMRAERSGGRPREIWTP